MAVGSHGLLLRRIGAAATELALIAAALVAEAPSAVAAGTVTITSIQGPSASSTVLPAAVEGAVTNTSLDAVFTDTNALRPALINVAINYGDGTPASTNQGGAGFDPNLIITQVGGAGGTTYTVTDSHTFPEESGSGSPPTAAFTVTLTVAEVANPSNSDSGQTGAQVADAPLAAPFPGVAPATFSGTGGTNTSGGAHTAMAAFEAAIGGVNNGAGPPEHASGFRSITWDGVQLNGTDPAATTITLNHTVALAANRFQGTGAFLPGQVAVSNDGYADVNPSVASPARFPAFSPANVFAPFNGNATEVDFVTPSSAGPPIPQAVRGFGAVFLNNRVSNSSAIAFYDGSVLLATEFVPASATAGTAEFLGALFTLPVVTKVVITTGSDSIFKFDGTTVTAGVNDNPPATNLVAMDDVAFSEPAPLHSIAGAAGVPFSSTVDSFVDTDPNGNARDYTATIHWGDGTVGPGKVSANGSGGFDVTPVTGHIYQAGTWSGTVTVRDFGSAIAVLPFTAIVTVGLAVLPALSNGAYGGYLTTAYIENIGHDFATVRIDYYDQAGNRVGAGDLVDTLAPNATWIVPQNNGHSFPGGGAGSAIISGSQPIAAFVNEFPPTNADASSYTGISLDSGVGTTLYAPTIANQAYGGYTTGIGLVNLATAAVTITANYRDAGGAVIKTQTVGAAAGAYVALYSGDPSLALPTGFAGTATISSSGGNLAAVVNETGPGGQFSSYNAVPSGSTTLFSPAALRNAYGGYTTGTGIQNTTGTAGTVTITYYNGSGTPTTTSHAIAANGYVGLYQGTDIPVDGAYTARITSTVAIAAIVNEVAPSANPAVQESTAYNTFAAGSSSLHLPLVESAGADGWSTGQGIMNTGSSSTTVTVTYYDPGTGTQVGTPDSLLLQPNAFWGLYQPAGGLPSGQRASATVTTSGGGQVAVICNESSATSFMSYTAQ